MVCGLASAQASDRASYPALSRSIAASFGRTWTLGRQCGVSLDGLSRRSAELLLVRRLQPQDLESALAAYDRAVMVTSSEACNRAALSEEIRQTDSFLRRYLQVYAPMLPQEFGQPKPLF